jgi:hypothetical protein
MRILRSSSRISIQGISQAYNSSFTKLKLYTVDGLRKLGTLYYTDASTLSTIVKLGEVRRAGGDDVFSILKSTTGWKGKTGDDG